jgi:hypothetical protein
VLGDPVAVEFGVSDTNPRKNNSVDMSATLEYEDGRARDISDDITAANTTSNDSSNTEFDFNNTSVRFTDDKNYTLNFTSTYGGKTLSDEVDVTVRPALDFSDYGALGPIQQVFVIFSDWSLLAIIASVMLGVIAGAKYSSTAGLAVMTVSLALSWAGGLVTIFVPATLILFEVFAFVVLDVQQMNN